VFSNDPCVSTLTPFCNDSTIMNCVCGRFDDQCCLTAWDYNCVDLVSYCSDTRDCLAESLPEVTNYLCSDAVPLPPSQFFKATNNVSHESSIDCLGVDAQLRGAWYSLSGTLHGSVFVDTCFKTTTVSTIVFLFEGKCGGHCLGKQSSTGDCQAQASFSLSHGKSYNIFVGSAHYGAIRVEFTTTPAKKSGLPGGAIAGIALLAIAIFVILLVAIYFLFLRSEQPTYSSP